MGWQSCTTVRRVPAKSVERCKAFLAAINDQDPYDDREDYFPHFSQLWNAMLLWEAKQASQTCIAATTLQQRGDAIDGTHGWLSWNDHLFIKDSVLYFGPEPKLSYTERERPRKYLTFIGRSSYTASGQTWKELSIPFARAFFEIDVLPFIDHSSCLALSAVCKRFRFLAAKVLDEEKLLLSLIVPSNSLLWTCKSPQQQKVEIRKALMWYGSAHAARPNLLLMRDRTKEPTWLSCERSRETMEASVCGPNTATLIV